jgi:hypothetical protein
MNSINPGTYQDVTDTTITAQFKAIKETLPENIWSLSKGDGLFLGMDNYPLDITFKHLLLLLAQRLVIR